MHPSMGLPGGSRTCFVLLRSSPSGLLGSGSLVWELIGSGLALAAALVLFSTLVWKRQRSRGLPGARPQQRLIPFLSNAMAALPTTTLWLFWLLGRTIPLAPLDRLLVALAVAWIIAPLAALALTAAGEALARASHGKRSGPPP